MLHAVSRRAFLHTLGIGSVSLVANCGPSTSPHQGRQTAELPLRILTQDPLNAEPVLGELVDSRGLEQPRTVEWNLKGYLFNAWDRVPLRSI